MASVTCVTSEVHLCAASGAEEEPLRTSDLLRSSHPTELSSESSARGSQGSRPQKTSLETSSGQCSSLGWGWCPAVPGSGSPCCLGRPLPCCWGCWCSRGPSAQGSGGQWGSVRGAPCASTSPQLEWGGHRPAQRGIVGNASNQTPRDQKAVCGHDASKRDIQGGDSMPLGS